MNGPVKMYRMKQIVHHDVPIKLPTCMYKMKNIYPERNTTADGPRDHVTPPNKKLDLIDQVKQFLKVLFISCIIYDVLINLTNLISSNVMHLLKIF